MTGRHSFGRYRALVALTAALAASGATAATASGAVTTFNNPGAIAMPDGPANPYPPTISASGLAGNVQKATVTLRGFTHTCPDDLAVLLVGPTGAKSILMGGVGGCPQGAGAGQPVSRQPRHLHRDAAQRRLAALHRRPGRLR